MSFEWTSKSNLPKPLRRPAATLYAAGAMRIQLAYVASRHIDISVQ
jgi:hypothetical protein